MRLRALDEALDNPSVLFARRAVSTLIGLALWAVGIFLAAALATWNVADPSLTHATAAPVQNLMGAPGAAIADPILQIFGLAAPLALVPFGLWGLRLLTGRPLGLEPSRVGAGIGALLLVPAFLNVLPVSASWPLPLGLGGVLGDAYGAILSEILGLSGTLEGLICGLLALLAAALAFHAVSPVRQRIVEAPLGYQIRRHDDEDEYGLDDTDTFEDEPSRWSAMLGMVLHHASTAGTTVRRLLSREGRDGVPRERRLRSALSHLEPTFAADASAFRRAAARVEEDDRAPEHETHEPRPQPRRRPAPPAAQREPEAPAPLIDFHDEPEAPPPPPERRPRRAVAERRTEPEPEAEENYVFNIPLRGPAARLQRAVAAAMAPSPAARAEGDDREETFERDDVFIVGEDAELLDDEDHIDQRHDYAGEDDFDDDSVYEDDPGDAEPEYDDADDDELNDAAARAAVEFPSAPRVLPQKNAMTPGRRAAAEAQPSFLPRGEYEFPPLALLTAPPAGVRDEELSEDALEANARVLEGVLEDFGVRGSIIHVRPGPVVTLYELEPAPGIKSSRVIGLADDIARSMSAISARVAVIPGKNAIGIELPNRKRITVFLRELLGSRDFERTKAKLPLCLGKTIGGEAVIADLARMPHLLVAGTTGSGKSVSINTMILSLLYWHNPEACRVILIDPKMLELSVYDGIPHLLTPVVTDPKKAVAALKWAVREMEDRYRKMAKLGVRNIDGFNARLKEAGKTSEALTRIVQTGFDKRTGEAIFEEERLSLEAMPYIVVIVDEMADLMMVAGKEIEGAIQRLAQMARAAGIHLIMATQRPSVDVITGTIKANFPTRISFQVTSKIDSRTILGEMGAEQLLGMGDMLFMAGGGRIQRVHGPFVSDEEVEDVVAHLKRQGMPDYLTEVLEDDEDEGGNEETGGLDALSESDDLYDRAVALVLRDKKASTSYVQRRLSIGYNRAATLIERMEREGVVSPANHAGKREILVGGEADEAA